MTTRVAQALFAALLALFISTRVVTAWLADHPDRYKSGQFTVVTDIDLYESWAHAIIQLRQLPYAQVPIEYPPGVLPFALLPHAVLEEMFSYQTRFIVLMLLVDVAGVLGLWRIARQSRSWLGVWLWTLGIPLLGPLVYARLDLVPAVATIWALERAASRKWTATGVFLGIGAMTKLYPALLMPLAFITSSRRRALAIGASISMVALLMPVVRSLPNLFRQVILYHTARGLSIESTWGALSLVGWRLGFDVEYQFDYGALLIQSSSSSILKTAGTLLMICGVAAGMVQVAKAARDDLRVLGYSMFATLAIVEGTAGVFSPQFVVWLIAIAAAAACLRVGQFGDTRRSTRASIMAPSLILPIAMLTQLLYPFMYGSLIARESLPLFVLVMRNALLLCAGVLALIGANGSGRSPEQPSVRLESS